MAFCRWNSTPLIPFEIGVDDNILGIYDNLSIGTGHFIGKVNFFLKINLSLYLVVFDCIVYYMIFYAILLKIKRNAAIIAYIFCLYFYIASFLDGACF